MADNIHEVVQLLAARIESHPEELGRATTDVPGWRWDKVNAIILPWLNTEEKSILRDVYLNRAHGIAMEELLGERRTNYDRLGVDAQMQAARAARTTHAMQALEQMRAQRASVGLANQYPSVSQLESLQNANTLAKLLGTKK